MVAPKGFGNVPAVQPESDAHPQVLRPFHNRLVRETQQVALLECLEAKVVKRVVPLVVDFGLYRVALRPHQRQQLVRHERRVRAVEGRAGVELLNDRRKRRARVLVVVRHHDALSELRVLRVRRVERRAQVGRQLVELHRRDPRINLRDDLLGNGRAVDGERRREQRVGA